MRKSIPITPVSGIFKIRRKNNVTGSKENYYCFKFISKNTKRDMNLLIAENSRYVFGHFLFRTEYTRGKWEIIEEVSPISVLHVLKRYNKRSKKEGLIYHITDEYINKIKDAKLG